MVLSIRFLLEILLAVRHSKRFVSRFIMVFCFYFSPAPLPRPFCFVWRKCQHIPFLWFEQSIFYDILEHSGLGHLCDKIVREEEFDLEGFAMLDPMDTEDLKELGVSYEDLPKFLRVLQAVKETLPWI